MPIIEPDEFGFLPDEFALASEQVYISFLSTLLKGSVKRYSDGRFYLDFTESENRLKRQFLKDHSRTSGSMLFVALQGAFEIPHFKSSVFEAKGNSRDGVAVFDMSGIIQQAVYLRHKETVSTTELEWVFEVLTQGFNHQLLQMQKVPLAPDIVAEKLLAYKGVKDESKRPHYIMVRPDAEKLTHSTYSKSEILAETDPVIKQTKLMQQLSSLSGEFLKVHSWELLYRTVTTLGANVTVIERETTGRAIYTRDPVISIPGRGILIPTNRMKNTEGRVKYEERQFFKSIFKTHCPKNIKYVEGDLDGGDVIPTFTANGKEIIFVGGYYHEEAKKMVGNLTDFSDIQKSQPFYLPLKDEYRISMPHADFAVAGLPHGGLLLCVDAIHNSTFATSRLKEHFSNDVIIVPAKEAKKGTLNLLSLGNSLVMPACSPELEQVLAKRGLEVITPEKLGAVQEIFLYAGGGPRCMTMEVDAGIAAALSRPLGPVLIR